MRLLFGFAGRRRFSLALFLLLMLGSVAEARSLRALSYNVWGLPKPFLVKGSRLRDIARLAPSLNADVIGFEETFAAKAKVLARMPEYPFLAYGPGKKGIRQSSGLLIASKFPIVQSAALVYHACAGVDCLSRKGVAYARVAVPGFGEVDVFVTHMNSAGSQFVRLAQVQEMSHFVEEYSSPDRPMILMGDFNYEPDGAAYWETAAVMGLRDTQTEFVASHPELPELEREALTWDPRINKNAKGRPRKLDYVWIRDSSSAHVETVRTRRVFDAPVSGRFLSDHFGLMVDVELESRAGAAKGSLKNN